MAHNNAWWASCKHCITPYGVFSSCRTKCPKIMTSLTRRTASWEGGGDRWLVADSGGELLLLTAGKQRVGSAAAGWLASFNVFVPLEWIIHFNPQLFPSGHLLTSHCVSPSGQDSAFQTPVRPVLRREHILSEIDPDATNNTTAANIYSPIVRFLTPSKESKCSGGHWKTSLLWVGFKILNSLWENLCLVCLIHGAPSAPHWMSLLYLSWMDCLGSLIQ